MKVLDPGHKYLLASYDGVEYQELTFVKREGMGYPGNVGHYAGTNIQEVLRVLIDRVNYLNTQIYSVHNEIVLGFLRGAIYELEERAARRHNRTLTFDPYSDPVENIETLPTCPTCGHIECKGEHKIHG